MPEKRKQSTRRKRKQVPGQRSAQKQHKRVPNSEGQNQTPPVPGPAKDVRSSPPVSLGFDRKVLEALAGISASSRNYEKLARDILKSTSLSRSIDPSALVGVRSIDPEVLSALGGVVRGRIAKLPALASPGQSSGEPRDEKPAVPEIRKLDEHAPKSWKKSQERKRLHKAIKDRRPTNLIVLAADIRGSNLLMKEAIDLYEFASTLESFTKTARETIWRHDGLFDKFTGDGFLAYWSFTPARKNATLQRIFSATQDLHRSFLEESTPRPRAPICM